MKQIKPPPDRLYGRVRGHKLRARQERLLALALPRLALTPEEAADPARAFGFAPREIALEIGFGSGEHSLAHIAAHPASGLIACEVFENGICSLLSRLIPDGAEATAPAPPNLRLWPGDARALLRILPAACLGAIFLLFPDPWPKARHAKRRFVHPILLPLIARALRPGGEWRVASDDPVYQDWVREVMACQEFFANEPAATRRPAYGPATRYEAKALSEGRSPLYWRFLRR
ncbi:MAG: tRNA (guanosine(46)-N7)-methyltransferase TrmB [Acetobacteraceae bacterium]|nr:tRNA (guanosine(46)-N7)-methyltransferase TrmB [Acetobacteraceae bacterium]